MGQDAPVQRDQAPPRPVPGSTGWLVLIWTAWVLVPAGLFLSAMGTLLTFLGDLPTEAERAEADRLIVLAGVTACAIPVIGLLVSLRARRQGSATVFGAAAALGLVLAVATLVGTAEPAPRSAVPRHDPGGACQELSGGDNRCPGD
jgi:hypothetical protein